jgi:hypothetical protein
MLLGDKPTPNQLHTCNICGAVGANLATAMEYAGGIGYVQTWFCRDAEACWRRRDERAAHEAQGVAA